MRKNIRVKSFVALLVLFLSLSVCAQNKKDTSKKNTQPKGDHTSITTKKSVFPPPRGFVNDFANVLDENNERKIENVLRQLQKIAKIDFAVAVIKSSGEKLIDDYSVEMAREWKLGAENGGVLLLVAINDRKWRIQIDRKLEQSLTNEEAKQVGDVMIDDFRRKDYATGLKKCIEKMIAVLAQKQNFEPITF